MSAVPAIYDTRITHVRTSPLRNAFTYRSYSWLVDLDALPRLPRALRPLARFLAGDHLGDPARTLRQNLDAFLADAGVDLGGGRVVMLANARTLGYVFNPLSVFWCHDAQGTLVCVVAEVHNTYGDRHAYLVRTDERGRARTQKRLYVSPFNPVEGEYQLSLPEPGATMTLNVTLHREGQRPFVATVRGDRRPAGALGTLRAAARVPWVTVVASAQIRWQGVRLWLRRLPVVPRPTYPLPPEDAP